MQKNFENSFKFKMKEESKTNTELLSSLMKLRINLSEENLLKIK